MSGDTFTTNHVATPVSENAHAYGGPIDGLDISVKTNPQEFRGTLYWKTSHQTQCGRSIYAAQGSAEALNIAKSK